MSGVAVLNCSVSVDLAGEGTLAASEEPPKEKRLQDPEVRRARRGMDGQADRQSVVSIVY